MVIQFVEMNGFGGLKEAPMLSFHTPHTIVEPAFHMIRFDVGFFLPTIIHVLLVEPTLWSRIEFLQGPENMLYKLGTIGCRVYVAPEHVP